ncbi:hypothetical protein WME91_53840 [Sorangium sp. So ce269]
MTHDIGDEATLMKAIGRHVAGLFRAWRSQVASTLFLSAGYIRRHHPISSRYPG